MRPTKTIIGDKAKRAILDGVNLVYKTAGKTLGPEGKNALLYGRYNKEPRITNDGYTVAECQDPKDIFVRLTTSAIKEACKRTNIKVGDGTTTTAVIAGKLYNDAYTFLNEKTSEFTQKQGVGVQALKRQILETAKLVKEKIREQAKKITSLEELKKIAIISVEDETLGKTIANIAWHAGVDGFIDVVEGYKGEIETEMVEGMRFAAKIPAKAFVNRPEKYQMIAEECPVLVTNYALDNAAWGEIGPMFQKLNTTTSKLIVIAPSFSDNVLIQMVNAGKQGYFFFPVAVPSLRAEQFKDLAIYCDAKFINKLEGMRFRNVGQDYLGFLEKLTVKDVETKEDAHATGGRGTQLQKETGKVAGLDAEVQMPSKIQKHIEELKGQLAETRQEQFKLMMERRIASMASAGGVIRVGATTQASSYYLKMKIEDAVWACRSALRSGYVKGGGLCLKEIADELDDSILKAALLQPYAQIQASVEGGIVITDDIVDPADAIYYAVEHSTQIVAQLVTVEIITAEVEEVQFGDGYVMMAKALAEIPLVMKKHFGLVKENEEEFERDRIHKVMLEQDTVSDLLELNDAIQ